MMYCQVCSVPEYKNQPDIFRPRFHISNPICQPFQVTESQKQGNEPQIHHLFESETIILEKLEIKGKGMKPTTGLEPVTY